MRSTRTFLASVVAAWCLVVGAHAGTATNVSGLYYSGVNDTYGLLAGGARDSHWTVTYARVAGTNYTGTSTYTGAAYVVSGAYIDAGWTPNTSSAQWIVAPGARTTSGGTANVGGDFLPGNGDTGTNAAQFVYRLAFTITGTGSSKVNNDVSISLTVAADDRYRIYVNPTISANGSVNTSSALAATRTNAWNNTQTAYLQNFSDSNSGSNSDFVIGTNYIYVVVDNTNSISGSSAATSFNPSGLLVYQVGAAVTIDGKAVPEVGTILPVVGALGLFVVRRLRRRTSLTPPGFA